MKKQQEKKVSMQSIANVLGVARSTVSFALNGKEKEGRISEEVAEKIRETARSMNYQFNEVARSLRTGSSHIIALVVADISDTFFGTLAYHLQEYMEEKGYLLVIVNIGEKKERLASVFKMLTNRQVDGIVMVPLANIRDGIIEQLNPKIPMVFIDRYFKTFRTSCIHIDNYEVSKMATQLLIGKGCKKIAVISYRESLMHIQERKRGFIDAMSAVELFDDKLVCEVDYSDSKDQIAVFLQDKFRDIPAIDGIFMLTGGLTSTTIRHLMKMGVRLQKDVQLIGFGRIDIITDVPIPYVKQPMMEMCKNSLDILLNQIKSQENKIIDCKLPASIVVD